MRINNISINLIQVFTIKKWPVSKFYKKVQIFLDFVNFYCRFIHHYSQIADLLTDLLKGSKAGVKTGLFIWLEKVSVTFHHLCDEFTKAPILCYFNLALRIRVKTNASNHGLAEIISQLQEISTWHSIAFWLRKLLLSEWNYEMYN